VGYRLKKGKLLKGEYNAAKQPGEKYAVCANCGETFKQVWRPKLKNYTSFKTCGRCRAMKARQAQTNTSVADMSYKPHPAQAEIHKSDARFKVIRAGARFGKDRCAINEMVWKLCEMLSEERHESIIPPVHAWIIGPTYRILDPVWKEFLETFPRKWWMGDPSKEERTLHTVNGGVVTARSAHQPEDLVGVGLDFCLITEAARIPHLEEVWSNIEMRLNSPGRGPGGTGGLAIINSTPVGKGFFYRMCRWGTKGDAEYNERFEHFHYSSYENPYLDHKELDDIRRRHSDRRFKQEVMAEFIDDASAVFPYPERCAVGSPVEHVPMGEREPHEIYTIGYDPAKSLNLAGVCVRDSHGRVVYITRWSDKSWTKQMDDITKLARYYNNAQVVMDRTGIGEVLPEALQQRGVDVEPLYVSNLIKEQMVSNLAFLIEQEKISYPYYEPLIFELKDYEYTITKTGNIRYSASTSRRQDDLVDAMMLAFKDYDSMELDLPFLGLIQNVP